MGQLQIKRTVLSSYKTNCYIITDEENNGVIVDPADNGPEIGEYIETEGIKLKAMLQTHGHSDHLGGSEYLRTKLSVPLYIHEADLDKAAENGVHPDSLLKGGEEIELLGRRWQVIHTPGHTPGSVCYYLPEEGLMFSGDTLFYGTYGRTDLDGGDQAAIERSITDILFALPEETAAFPGHGMATDIKSEKKHNMILMR